MNNIEAGRVNVQLMTGARSCNGVDWSIVQSKYNEIAHDIIDVIGSAPAHTSQYHGRGFQ